MKARLGDAGAERMYQNAGPLEEEGISGLAGLLARLKEVDEDEKKR
jgi:hypothetical protein